MTPDSDSDLVLEIRRGTRGALMVRRHREREGDYVDVRHYYPDEQTNELKPGRGVRVKLTECAALGAALQALGKTVKRPDDGAFVGTRHVARRGGPCLVCGGSVAAGEAYLWSAPRKGGAHLQCGRETAPPSTRTSPPRQRELPSTRRQPQDNLPPLSDEERRELREAF